MKSVVLVILAVSLLGIGVGQTAISVLGIPYIDDNVQSKQSPLYMAITIGVRGELIIIQVHEQNRQNKHLSTTRALIENFISVLGPAIGYYLGSFCIRQYVDLTRNVDPTDPNFIGAWWLGKSPTHKNTFPECNRRNHMREKRDKSYQNPARRLLN